MEALTSMGFSEDIARLSTQYSMDLSQQASTCIYLNEFGKKPKRLCQQDGFHYTFVGSSVTYNNMNGIVKHYCKSIESVLVHLYTESPWNFRWIALHDPLLEWNIVTHDTIEVFRAPRICWERVLGTLELDTQIFRHHSTIEESWKFHSLIRFSNSYHPLWHAIHKCCSNMPNTYRITPNDPQDVKHVYTHKIAPKRRQYHTKLMLYCHKYKVHIDRYETLCALTNVSQEDRDDILHCIDMVEHTRECMVRQKNEWEAYCVPMFTITFVKKKEHSVVCNINIHNESFYLQSDDMFIFIKTILTNMTPRVDYTMMLMSQKVLLNSMKEGKKEYRGSTPDTLMKHQRKALSWMMYRESIRCRSLTGWGWSKRRWDDGFVCYQSIWGEFSKHVPGSRTVRGGIVSLPTGSGKTAICCHLVGKSKQRTLIVAPTSLTTMWQEEFNKHVPGVSVALFHPRKRVFNENVIIASYRNVVHSFDVLNVIPWVRIICDEIHTFKHSDCKTIQYLAELKALYKWCITATPIHSQYKYSETLLKTLNVSLFQKKHNNFEKMENTTDAFTKFHYQQHICNLFRDIGYYKESIFDYQVSHQVKHCSYPTTWSRLYNAFIQQNKQYKHQLFFFHHMRLLANHPCLLPMYRYGTYLEEDQYIDKEHVDGVIQALNDDSAFHQSVKDIIQHGGTCAICLDVIHQPTMTDCKHIFCKECIQTNYNIRKQCPQCRHDIESLTHIVTEQTATTNDMIKLRIGTMSYNVPKHIHDTYLDAIHCTPKINTLIDILHNTKQKTIVFTNISNMLPGIERRLMEESIGYCIIRGSQRKQQRLKMVQAFQQDNNKQVFLLTLKTAAEGLTLTAASHIVFMEPCTNHTLVSQAIGRVKRIGQTQPIQTTTIIMKQTMDEIIYKHTNKQTTHLTDHKTLFHGDNCESFAIYRSK